MDHVADYPKLASSAAHLFGRPRAFTESFAAFTHRPSVIQAKWVLDYQMIRGINSVQVMFMSASTRRSPPPAPASNNTSPQASQAVRRTSFFQSDSFPQVAQYVNRATYLLSQGRPAAQIGLYFPTLSMWYGDNESNTSLLDISRQLMENQVDFDFVDEQALSSVLVQEKGTLINQSKQAYRAIIIPSVSVISQTTLEKLKKFASAGGKVIFIGTFPSLVTEKTFKDASGLGDLSWAVTGKSGTVTPEIIGLLPQPDFRIDKPVPELKYLHRNWKDADLYFIFNEGEKNVSFNAEIKGSGKPEEWNALTGIISPLKTLSAGKDKINVKITLNGGETKFIIIRK
jgi:hypothetical protein